MTEIDILDQQLAHLRDALQSVSAAIAAAEQRRSLLLRAEQVQRAVSAIYTEPVYHVQAEQLKQLGEGS